MGDMDHCLIYLFSQMFHPAANRLCGFLEISALFIQLAQSGGWQAKAGMLTIEAASKKSGGFGRKNASWSDKNKQRWCAVRDGYLVAVEEPGDLKIWDVFLLDSDFKIERPRRVYRQGLNLLQHGHLKVEVDDIMVGGGKNDNGHGRPHVERHEYDQYGTFSKVKSKLARALHLSHISLNKKHGRHEGSAESNGDAGMGGRHSTTGASFDRTRSHTRSMSASSMSSGASSASSVIEAGMRTPMVDPSTNMNPMRDEGPNEPSQPGDGDGDSHGHDPKKRRKKKKSKDVSKHTFYVSNAQMRLKCFAKNERQMQQWITALEKTAAASHWAAGSNRFGSFAPIRLNVAAQWLVDGVSTCIGLGSVFFCSCWLTWIWIWMG